MGKSATLENYWQQAFELGETCWDCHFCVNVKNVHPYGESYCVESGRDCSVRQFSECPGVQARLSGADR